MCRSTSFSLESVQKSEISLLTSSDFCLLMAVYHTQSTGVIMTLNHITLRGIYGGVPTQLFERGKTLADYAVNAIFLGSGGLSSEAIALLKQQGARVFAEFNTMHEAGFVAQHPDAAPVGIDGNVCPPPDGWQGVCPTHPGYRRER